LTATIRIQSANVLSGLRARHDAYTQMLDHAKQLGANAIIAMRYDATEFMQGATEVLAYGTAVIVERT